MLSFIDRFFKLCYILPRFRKGTKSERLRYSEAERGISAFFGFSFLGYMPFFDNLLNYFRSLAAREERT